MQLSRRRLFQVGFGGSLLVSAGGALRWVTSGYALQGGQRAIGLSVKELCVARAIVETLLPADDGLPSGVELGIVQRIDEEVWAASESLQGDLRAALQLLEHGPPLFGSFGRLTRLAPDARAECYRRYLSADNEVFVLSAQAYRQMAHLFYYADARLWPAIEYDGPWVPEPKPPESTLRYRAILEGRG
jgi:hypothetical protein